MIASVLLLGGCFGPADPGGEVAEDAAELAPIPEAQLDATWIVAVATEEAMAPYGGQPGWVALVVKRDLREAVRQLGPAGGLPAARAHADAAALFRQAALVSAHSMIEVYGVAPEPTDPHGAQHLVAVGHAMLGERVAARTAAGKLVEAPGERPIPAWHAPWAAWIADPAATWPPDLSVLPVTLPKPAVGKWPKLSGEPHYRLPERDPATGVRLPSRRSLADPGALLALAAWHDAAATLAAGESAASLPVLRAGYRLPVEPVPTAPEGLALPLDLLFGGDLLRSEDGVFLAELLASRDPANVDRWAERSLLAWLARDARGGGPTIVAERAVDRAAELRDALVERARVRSEGRAQGHHRPFADIAMVGALRGLAMVAEVEGDQEVSGLLRHRAWELSERAAADPVGLVAMAAWDASNRYPLRALDILHAQSGRYPSLQVARYGLDVLALRVDRERAREAPGL